jgi:hypothetical protein
MRESEVLTLSTIHGAKGLEFSHVWLVQMAEVCTICMCVCVCVRVCVCEREREREREASADGGGMCLPLYVHLYPGLFLSIHLSLRNHPCTIQCLDVIIHLLTKQ